MTENSVSLLGKIAGFTEILAKDPQSTVFVSLSEAYRQLGMLDDALEIAGQGTRNLPGFSPGFVAMGRILAQQGDLTRAALVFEQALAIERDSLQALKGLARTRYRQGYLDKARELLLHAAQLSPQDPVVSKMLASIGAPGEDPASDVLPAKLSDSSETAPASEPVLAEQTQPGAAEVLPEAVTATVESTPAADLPSAREPVIEEIDEPGEPSVPLQTTTLAQLYFKQGLYDEASAIYREILRHNPQDEDTRARLVHIKNLQSAADSENVPDLKTEAFSAPGVPSETKPVQEPLEIFQRWLNAIEQRRVHVC